jgi:tetratricopeptide (TPR) repeat protein
MKRFIGRGVAAFAVLAAQPAAAEWREASTDHFLIYADSGERWLRTFAEGLERSAAAMDRLQPSADRTVSKSNRVVIYAVPGLSAVQKLCGKCGSVAGFYVPRVGHSVAYTARTPSSGEWDMSSDIVLFHEYAHHFLLTSSSAALPRWYNEGFAEFFSTIQGMPDGAVQIGRPAKHRAYNVLNANMKIEQLIDSTGRQDSLSQDIFYGRAWMLTHMLMFDRARQGQLGRYLAALNKGTPNLQAAQEAFGDLAVLRRDMDDYVRDPIRSVKMPPDMIKAGPVTLRALTAGEAAMMPVRLRSDRGVNRQQALDIVADARKLAAAYTGDAGAQVVLAEAEYDAGNDAEAEAAADRALAANPRDIDALLYKGRVRVRQARAARAKDPAAWSAARSWFVKANRADPDAAEPLLLFYQSFAAAGQAPTKNATLGLYRALELSPQDPGLRIAAARQYVVDGDLTSARRALLPLAYDPHVPADKNRFARVVEMIDAKKPIADILKAGTIAGGSAENGAEDTDLS